MPEYFTDEEKLDMFPVLESVEIINMLIYLNNEGPQTHASVKKEFRMPDEKYNNYFSKLLRVGLVDYDRSLPTTDKIYGRVLITEKGKQALKLVLQH